MEELNMKTYNQQLHEDFYRKIEYTRQLARKKIMIVCTKKTGDYLD